jgi:hypothetical protein
MNGLSCGCWAIADQSLQWIGRGAAWLLLRRPSTDGGRALDAAIGGAFVCAVFGGVVGFGLSDLSREIGAIDGAILGSSLGVCLGFLLGSFVETVDSMIKDLLSSFNSK